jgi:hypothetical protein
MSALADADGDVFLPNPRPNAPSDYIFICMEPSLGRWAQSPEQAKERVAAGFLNFVSSVEDFIVHFCARAYLCESGQRYHITDLSKGAMLVDSAHRARSQRYARWYDILLEELELVATRNAGVVAIGGVVARHLIRNGFSRPFARAIHFSGQAASARRAGVVGREAEFQAFEASVSMADLIGAAEAVLESAQLPANLRDATLERLANTQLTASRKQLMFNYKLTFQALRSRQQAAIGTSRPGAV